MNRDTPSLSPPSPAQQHGEGIPFPEMMRQIRALCGGRQTRLSVMANIVSYLFWSMERINWAGFYLLEDGILMLGPFQGKPACVEIALGRGICGTAAMEGHSVVVPDVLEFPDHIACDADSRSEIVTPILLDGSLFGVLDVDSPELSRFGEDERIFLENVVRDLERRLMELQPFSP